MGDLSSSNYAATKSAHAHWNSLSVVPYIRELPLEQLCYGALTNKPLELVSACLRGGVGEPFWPK